MDLLESYFSQYDFLGPEEIEVFKNNVEFTHWKAGQTIQYEGKVRSRGGFILTGLVRLFQNTEDGKEKTIWIADEGSLAGDPISVFNNIPSDINFEILEESVIVMFNHEELSKAELKLPRIAIFKGENLEKEVCEVWNRMRFFATMNPQERFEFLMENRPTLFDRVQQRHLASYIGVTDVSMSRIKKRYIDKKQL